MGSRPGSVPSTVHLEVMNFRACPPSPKREARSKVRLGPMVQRRIILSPVGQSRLWVRYRAVNCSIIRLRRDGNSRSPLDSGSCDRMSLSGSECNRLISPITSDRSVVFPRYRLVFIGSSRFDDQVPIRKLVRSRKVLSYQPLRDRSLHVMRYRLRLFIHVVAAERSLIPVLHIIIG